MSTENSQLIQTILFCIDDEYRNLRSSVSVRGIKDKNALFRSLRIAEMNGVLYPFCTSLLEEPALEKYFGLIKVYLRREQEKLSLLKETLEYVNAFFEKWNLDLIFIKLYRGLPYVPRDVDILVRSKDIERIVYLFRDNGFSIKVDSDVEIKCQRGNLLKIDLYGGFYYFSRRFIGDDFLWKQTRAVDIQNVNCQIPNAEADFLTLLIHSLLGHRWLSLLDFLYAKNMLNLEQLNLDKMQKEAKAYGWENEFRKILKVLKALYKSLYFEPNSAKRVSFPFIYSTKFALETFKRFAEPGTEIRKELLFILSAFGDAAYHEYLSVQRSIPVEIPEPLKDMVSKTLFRVRQKRGDRKILA